MYDQTSILPICSKLQRNTNEAPFVEIIAAKTSDGTGGRSVCARKISVRRRCSWRVGAERRKRRAARPCEAFYLGISGLRTSRQEDRCGSSKEQGARNSGSSRRWGGCTRTSHVHCVRANWARSMHADAQRAQATEHVRDEPPADRCWV